MSSFTITLEIPALDRLTAAITAQIGAGANTAVPTVEGEPTPKPATRRAAPKTDPKPETEQPDDATVDVDALKATATTAAMKLQKAQGRDALIALLGEFDAANISALTADQLVEFATKADEKSA